MTTPTFVHCGKSGREGGSGCNTGSPVRDPALIRDPALPAPIQDPALIRYLALIREPAVRVISAPTQIRRASDSWSWERGPGPTPQECVRQ